MTDRQVLGEARPQTSSVPEYTSPPLKQATEPGTVGVSTYPPRSLKSPSLLYYISLWVRDFFLSLSNLASLNFLFPFLKIQQHIVLPSHHPVSILKSEDSEIPILEHVSVKLKKFLKESLRRTCSFIKASPIQ